MASSDNDLFDKAMQMSVNVEDNFLELGKTLSQLNDESPNLFKKVWKTSQDLGRRKAYYLKEISDAFDPLQVSRERLRKIGWTKLQKLTKLVNQDDVEELVTLAEPKSMTAEKLEGLLKGKAIQRYEHVVQLHLSSPQYEKYVKALLQHGVVKAKGGQGLKKQGRATAFMKLIDKVLAIGENC